MGAGVPAGTAAAMSKVLDTRLAAGRLRQLVIEARIRGIRPEVIVNQAEQLRRLEKVRGFILVRDVKSGKVTGRHLPYVLACLDVPWPEVLKTLYGAAKLPAVHPSVIALKNGVEAVPRGRRAALVAELVEWLGR